MLLLAERNGKAMGNVEGNTQAQTGAPALGQGPESCGHSACAGACLGDWCHYKPMIQIKHLHRAEQEQGSGKEGDAIIIIIY